MPQGASQVSSASTIKGPEKDTKEVIVLTGVVLFLGGLAAAAWLNGQASDQVQTTTLNQVGASGIHSSQVAAPAASIPDIIHADIYLEVGRKGLTNEGKAQLASQADRLKRHEDYGVLIQRSTDQPWSKPTVWL